MLKNVGKRILILIVTIILCAVIGFLALMLVCALPSGRAALHVRESGEILKSEGDYWSIIPSDQLSMLDNFTDCIMLLTSAYTGDENCVQETVYAYRIYQKGATKEESCAACGAVPEEEASVQDYVTYWHGYKVVLKPLLFFFNLNQIRQINALVILGCIILISILLYRNHLTAYIFPYLLGAAFLNIPVVMQSLQFSTVFHVTSVFSILLLAGAGIEKLRSRNWLLFLLAGISTSYFDFLTYPVAVIGFLLVIYIGLTGVYGEYSYKTVLSVIARSVVWGVGYAGMWGMKWLIATVISGENVFTLAFEKLAERSSNVAGDIEFTAKEMYHAVNSYTMSSAVKVFVLLFLILMLILVIRSKGWKDRRNYIAAVLLAVIACYPLMWYFVTKNHTYHHLFFTYRSMCVAFFAGAALLNPLLKIGKRKPDERETGKGKTDQIES